MEKVRVAVIGCGAVAASHYLPALQACRGAAAALLVDPDRERARALGARFGVADVAVDHRQAIGEVEAAVVAAPNHLHAPIALDLLRAGVHVLVEKPMALTPGDCEALIAAAAASGARLTVGLQFRFFDSTRLVSRLFQAGVLGELRRFELRLGVVSRWPFATDFLLRRETAGGGVLVDYGVHVLDLLLHWLGDPRLAGYRDDACGGVEANCELDLELASGARGRVEISRTRKLRNTCVFEGETARLEVGVWDPDPPLRLSREGEEVALVGRARAGSGERGLDFTGAFRRQLDDFAAALRAGREPAVSGREASRSIGLIAACYAARAPLELPWTWPPQLGGRG
jgi:predicted dehydrogenase